MSDARSVRSRGLASLTSQVLNTASNLILTFAVARSVSAEHFGGWSIAYVLYIIGLQLTRATASMPMLISSRIKDDADPKDASRRTESSGESGSVSVALVVGATIAIVQVGAILTEPFGIDRVTFIPFLFGIAPLLVNESLRYIYFKRNNPRGAAVMDAITFGLQTILFVAIIILGVGDAWAFTSAWALAALVSTGIAIARLKVRPGTRSLREYVTSQRHRMWRLLIETGLINLATQAVPFIVVTFAGLAAAGYLRAGQTFMGGLGILVMGLTPQAIVEAKGLLPRIGDYLFLVRWAGLIFVAGGVYGLAVLFLPERYGTFLVGDSWAGASALLLPLVLQGCLRGVPTGVPIILKARDNLTEAMRLRVFAVFPTVLLPAAGALLSGASGAAWGIFMSAVIVTLLSLWRLVVSRHKRLHHPEAGESA